MAIWRVAPTETWLNRKNDFISQYNGNPLLISTIKRIERKLPTVEIIQCEIPSGEIAPCLLFFPGLEAERGINYLEAAMPVLFELGWKSRK